MVTILSEYGTILKRDIFRYKPFCIMGRSSNTDIAVRDTRVSRFHCMLISPPHISGIYLVAFGLNGTHLNTYPFFGKACTLDSVIALSLEEQKTSVGGPAKIYHGSKMGNYPLYIPHGFTKLEELFGLLDMLNEKNTAEKLVSWGQELQSDSYVGLGEIGECAKFQIKLEQ